jgi:hypothetical protein
MRPGGQGKSFGAIAGRGLRRAICIASSFAAQRPTHKANATMRRRLIKRGGCGTSRGAACRSPRRP